MRPAFEVMTRMSPSFELCPDASRNTQNHWSLNRTRSVNALCGPSSQILRTSTSPALSCTSVWARVVSSTAPLTIPEVRIAKTIQNS
jgi:hypothetical protein